MNQEVRLCGFITHQYEDSNIWLDADEEERGGQRGLGLTFSNERTIRSIRHNQFRCLRGVVKYTGCDGELICSWTTFRYGLYVTD